MKTQYSNILLVDNGGFFPEDDLHISYSWFLMDAMKVLGTDAVGCGDRDLRFGIQYLKGQIKRTGLSMLCANLYDRTTKKPVLASYVIKTVGPYKVGIFGLITDKGDLGPGKDSLAVADPLATARTMVTELKRKGAQVIVLLSQLGKTEGEDLVTAVDGIDAVEMGRNVILVQRGRMVKNTIACYGGEQGQYVCKTEITLDDKHKMTTGDAEAVLLGPEFPDKPEIASLVKGFEDALNEKNRKIEMENAAKSKTQQADNSVSHYIGSELCIRCHPNEGAQWKTTAHSQAFNTLQIVKRDADAECVGCHSVGYGKPGGFLNFAATPAMTNVQCENCHGMGTEHDAFATAAHRVDANVCMGCHTKDRDPDFNFDTHLPKIIHSNSSGETLAARKVKAPGDEKKVPNMLKAPPKGGK